MTDLQRCHEEGFVGAFIEKNKQDRSISFLASAKHRRKFTVELAHFKGLDERFSQPIPPKTAHMVKEICQLLKSRGAGQTVWIISELASLDGRELDLEEALSHVWGRKIGSVLSCLPGKLAYFEDEEKQRLLVR
ncbi:MAG: hypothetical protein M3Y50_02860 [Acidobacteriota bacterium]|nr:hypothetical protein [Acidobacteriota bacterium]